jgi:hypothetical protein
MNGAFRTTPAIRREMVKSGRASESDITEWETLGDITKAEANEYRDLISVTS